MVLDYHLIKIRTLRCRHLHCIFFCLLTIAAVLGVQSSYPQSSDCVPDKGKDCPDLSQKKSDLRVCDKSTCRYGGICRDNGADIKCVCQFQCHEKYIPVCGSNGDTYQNECYLKQAACTQQRLVSLASPGPCDPDSSSGSGDGDDEGSGTDTSKKLTKCSNCKYGAECDEDSEDEDSCSCKIDCSGHNENPVCGTDGNSYNNPCLVREASCLKQEQIDVKHLGRCPDKGKKNNDEGLSYKPDLFDPADPGEGKGYGWMPIPCTDDNFCVHGHCEFKYGHSSCRCDSGYTGPQCEEVADFNILYVVPSGQKLHYVLIASIIGAVQIAIIVAVVMCITRKCPKNNRGRRQKQNLGHFSSDTSSRMM
ncbi:tomoregulin-1b [Neoarius graeffei]|uniref:tomoregulin-1b n=1 Tax=Neoarius graeffei TaxID=443677 RepID=UPI00298C66F1|nr:tomoregulin-1b [Neoarius graeffei]